MRAFLKRLFARALMTIALVAGANVSITGAANGGTSAAIDTSGASLLIFHLSHYFATATSVSDSKGNTWTGLTAQGSDEPRSRIFYAENPTVGTNHTFTITGVGSYSTGEVAGFSGAATTTVADQETGAVVNPGTTLSTGSITPSENNCLVVAGLSVNKDGSPYAINASMTITDQFDYESGVNEGGALAYIVQTTAAAINPQWSGFASGAAAATIASFKAAGGAAGKPWYYYANQG